MWAFRRFRKVRQAVGVPRVGSLSREFLSRRKTHDGRFLSQDGNVMSEEFMGKTDRWDGFQGLEV